MCTTYSQCPQKPEDSTESLAPGVTGTGGAGRGAMWVGATKPSPPEEQQVLLIASPDLI